MLRILHSCHTVDDQRRPARTSADHCERGLKVVKNWWGVFTLRLWLGSLPNRSTMATSVGATPVVLGKAPDRLRTWQSVVTLSLYIDLDLDPSLSGGLTDEFSPVWKARQCHETCTAERSRRRGPR
jgi:hypothetical protein